MNSPITQTDSCVCYRTVVAGENLDNVRKIRRPFAVIIKPTDSCNMACSYCYVNHKSEKLWMDDDVLEASISKITELIQGQRLIHFIWHGGEPLMHGLRFFEKVVEIE